MRSLISLYWWCSREYVEFIANLLFCIYTGRGSIVSTQRSVQSFYIFWSIRIVPLEVNKSRQECKTKKQQPRRGHFEFAAFVICVVSIVLFFFVFFPSFKRNKDLPFGTEQSVCSSTKLNQKHFKIQINQEIINLKEESLNTFECSRGEQNFGYWGFGRCMGKWNLIFNFFLFEQSVTWPCFYSMSAGCKLFAFNCRVEISQMA